MTFERADEVDMICFQMKQADYTRALNRALINNLFNGFPPYSETEVQENNISVNVNDLTGTVVAHDARSQFYSAFLKPGNYFTCATDAGPVHKRKKFSSIVTKEINRVMKRSLPYMECFRSKFALDVLHGIAPSAFRDSERWCPEPLGVEDVMIPANTLLTMYNLPFFALYHSYTAPELIKLTRGPRVDPGWNVPLAEACIKWVDEQSASLMSNNWPEFWSPEKAQERLKGSGGFYLGDAVPTVNVWDFYFWNDDKKQEGWNRRMVLDSWSEPATTGGRAQMVRRQGEIHQQRGQFLYNSGDRKFADCREEIINWQFADLSAVAPFRYHSVRSLGFLLYAVCHLQNRLRCKFNEAVFEQLMVLMRVKSGDEGQRALKVDLFNRGFVDDSVDFIKAQDRYQVNTALAELGLNENRALIQQNSSSYTAQPRGQTDRKEKTATQFMGEMQTVTQLVSAGLLQAYEYQKPEYREIFRRFTRKQSTDPEVRTFQANCLRQDVPEKILYHAECWEQEPERVMGAGNKTLELAIAEKLMAYRNLYDPEPQRDILRDVTLAITDDAARAEALVPDEPVKVTDSVHDAQLSAGVLLQGLPVALKTGMNHIEYVDTMLASLAMVIQKAKTNGDMATADQIIGMNNLAQHIAQHIQLIAQDKNEKSRVKQYGDALGKLMNEVKAFAQRLMEQQKQAKNGEQMDPETMAKIQSIMLMAKAKAENTRESHAQRTAQRQVQFEMEQQQKQSEFEAEMRRDLGLGKTAHEMQLAETEAAHGMKLDEHALALESLKARHEAALKQRQSEQDLELQRQESSHKMELQRRESEHKQRLAEKTAAAAPKKK